MEIIKALIAAAATIIAAVIGYFTYQKRNIRHKLGDRKLKYHPVHQRMNDFKEYIKYEINAENDGREGIVQDFLLHMIEIYRLKFKELSDIVDNKDLTDEELKELNLSLLHNAINERSTYFFTDEYTRTERMALDLLIKKYQVKQSERIKYFRDDIRKVVDSKYYNDQITMQALIFDKYIGEFSHIMTWFEDVIDDINGDFNGLEFKGKNLDHEED
ncbi:MAG: hypothetical protein ACQEQF_00300 [Bacillota bacterium]